MLIDLAIHIDSSKLQVVDPFVYINAMDIIPHWTLVFFS
nr:L681 [uncultured bacterium]